MKKVEKIKELLKNLSNEEKLEVFNTIPVWIGAEVWVGDSSLRICIGLNQEDGNDISYCSGADIEAAEKHGQDAWCYGNDLTVKIGENVCVFDDNHNLIK